MSEQYPLLCDDLSEEERLSPRCHRRHSMTKGRVRNHVKGAVAIITRWPGHWTTLLTYWWIAVGMIAITTFLIYNSLFSCALPQPSYHNMPNKPINIDATKHLTLPQLAPKVFMHIFINDKDEINLNDYVPYIEIITNKYKNFEYELLVVANDTNAERYWGDEENNEMALNALWEDDFSSLQSKKLLRSAKNLKIKYFTISNYLNESPLKKYWKHLPYQFIKFLVRAVSIWEKGGIAFDPVVLTPQSPHSIYIEKIQSILSKYKNKKVLTKTTDVIIQQTPKKQASKYMPKVNNIQDIINALEIEEIHDKSNQETLAVAETKYDVMSTQKSGLKKIETKVLTENITKNLGSKTTYNVDSNDLKLNHEIILRKETTKGREKGDDSHKLSLLTLFLDYLFHNKQSTHEVQTTTDALPHQENKDARHKANLKTKVNSTVQMKEFWNKIRNHDNYRPMIISAQGILNDTGKVVKNAKIPKLEDDKLFEVTVDLKGNMIATDTACHAFVGSLFTNAIHHEHGESVTDFIIKELSIFCKGLLTSCMGIDVILL